MSRHYLAIDQGGHASRALLFNGGGQVLARAEVAVATFNSQPDWVEHDAEEMVRSIQQAVQQVLAHGAGQVVAAGLATQRSSVVCWDKLTGAALSPVLSWQDRRQHLWLQQFAAHNHTIHDKTGLFLSPHYGASKLRWCLDNLDAVAHAYRAGRLCMGPLASFLAFRLLDERPFVVDPANASRTLLWSMQHNQWDVGLCELFGVPMEILPQCGWTQAAFGHLSNIPLRILTGDQSAAIFAWGAPQADAAYINIGTGAFIQRMMPTVQHSARLLCSTAYLDAQYQCYTLEGTVNGAARALQWYAQQHVLDETQFANWLSDIRNPPLFINGISGIGSPYWVANLDSYFVGDDTEPAAQYVAIIESIVFLLQRNLQEMPPSSGAPLLLSGGLSKLDGLCQRLANLSGQSVLRPSETEATAQGLAWLVADRPSVWLSAHDAAQCFVPHVDDALQGRYMRWLAAMATKVGQGS